MKIGGKTRTCGLIGNPVEHTLSPVIHNTLAEMFGHDLVYVPFHVETGRLAAAVEGAAALNLLGLNVTVPYKSDVISCLRGIDPLAENIGAVNTLVRTSGGYKGYNTDMEGLCRAMETEGVGLSDEEILLLGAGGVSRAVAYLCAAKGAKKVYLLNRTLEKAGQVAAEVNASAGREVIYPMALADFGSLPDRRFLAIQGTSVGMFPNTEHAVIEDEAFYRRVHTGFDLIYTPWETKFMKLVTQNGGQAFNGLKMLLYQGVIAYELWNGVKVSEEQAQAVYQKLRTAVGQTE
ncbi:MAG: shikimate dehydrogenase [Bacteroidales bacterium]|nr:shikimate dehydrogenase [Bacteroidales bacterium]MCM1416315.1 shikimate dehydrogenase [bacterium]MCM1424251.1 shikimate dehydrogenase [bacterium]